MVHISDDTARSLTAVFVTVVCILSAPTVADICDLNDVDTLSIESTACVQSPNHTFQFSDMFSAGFWNDFCILIYDVDKCLQNKFSQCHPDQMARATATAMIQILNSYESWIPTTTELQLMRRQGCKDDQVLDETLQLYRRGDNMKCLEDGTKDEVTDCVRQMADEQEDIRQDGISWFNVPDDRQEALLRFGRAMFQCVLGPSRILCDVKAQELLLYVVNLTLPSEMRHYFQKTQLMVPLYSTDIMSTRRDTVGVYGDPHLIVYNISQPVTCTAPGDHVYITNAMFKVTGNNKVIQPDNEATFISELTVTFFDSGYKKGVYSAVNGDLPAQFTDTTKKLSPFRNPIQIIPINPNKIQINSTDKAFIFLIQKRDDEYFFSLRLGRPVLESSSGALVTGCSYKDHYTKKPVIPSRATVQTCSEACTNVSDGSLDLTDTCLFDCHITGDTKYAAIDKSFLEDMRELQGCDAELPLVEPPAPAAPVAPHVSSATGSTSGRRLSCLTFCLLVALSYSWTVKW